MGSKGIQYNWSAKNWGQVPPPALPPPLGTTLHPLGTLVVVSAQSVDFKVSAQKASNERDLQSQQAYTCRLIRVTCYYLWLRSDHVMAMHVSDCILLRIRLLTLNDHCLRQTNWDFVTAQLRNPGFWKQKSRPKARLNSKWVLWVLTTTRETIQSTNNLAAERKDSQG